MGSIQTSTNRRKRSRLGSSSKSYDGETKSKATDRFRTRIRSLTFGPTASTHVEQNSISSSTISCQSPSTTIDSEPFLNDFDYRKLATLTGLTESKISDLHREFLILSQNGRLTYERFKSMLDSISNENGSMTTENLTRQTFDRFDRDGNNYLDFVEFIAAFITMEKNESVINQSSSNSSMKPSTTTFSTQQRIQMNDSTVSPAYYSTGDGNFLFLTSPYVLR